MEGMSQGDILVLTTTDTSSQHDVISWARAAGHTVLDTKFSDIDNIFEIEKG